MINHPFLVVQQRAATTPKSELRLLKEVKEVIRQAKNLPVKLQMTRILLNPHQKRSLNYRTRNVIQANWNKLVILRHDSNEFTKILILLIRFIKL